jgi:hypothetical protein
MSRLVEESVKLLVEKTPQGTKKKHDTHLICSLTSTPFRNVASVSCEKLTSG